MRAIRVPGAWGSMLGRPAATRGNAGWSLPGFREGKGLVAATGGTSAFLLLPGICKRYVDGELTHHAPLAVADERPHQGGPGPGGTPGGGRDRDH